ncbi:hypothetical protein GDO78_014812 [Eleutherodactylus coqui]|uniref:Uncharacterized protein n=1 Tax=Eleutherodactylus coqui TaxID=57060 RepID=A0A8J6BFB5_ELECQ|nr:hypothetical protein GDO78_014812 [Eleutherodactylus coqui]
MDGVAVDYSTTHLHGFPPCPLHNSDNHQMQEVWHWKGLEGGLVPRSWCPSTQLITVTKQTAMGRSRPAIYLHGLMSRVKTSHVLFWP